MNNSLLSSTRMTLDEKLTAARRSLANAARLWTLDPSAFNGQLIQYFVLQLDTLEALEAAPPQEP